MKQFGDFPKLQVLASGSCSVCKNTPALDKAVLYPVLFSMSRDIKKFPREICALKSVKESKDKTASGDVTTSEVAEGAKTSGGGDATGGAEAANADDAVSAPNDPPKDSSVDGDAEAGAKVDAKADAKADVEAAVEDATASSVGSSDQKSKCVVTVCSMNCVLEVERQKDPGH